MSDISPAYDAVPIVNDVAIASCRAIYVGVGGDISVQTAGGARIFKNAISGTIIPVNAIKVNASGTTATNLLAMF
jgi:hypothetical protein